MILRRSFVRIFDLKKLVWKAPPHLEYEIFIGYCIDLCAYILYITRYSGFIDTFHGNKFRYVEGIFIRSCTDRIRLTFHKSKKVWIHIFCSITGLFWIVNFMFEIQLKWLIFIIVALFIWNKIMCFLVINRNYRY